MLTSFWLLISGSTFLTLVSAQWSRWDDTDWCFPRVQGRQNVLCCQGTVYSDSSARYACCDGRICDLTTGTTVDASRLNPIETRNGAVGSRPQLAVVDPVPTYRIPYTPQSRWVRPLPPDQVPVQSSAPSPALVQTVQQQSQLNDPNMPTRVLPQQPQAPPQNFGRPMRMGGSSQQQRFNAIPVSVDVQSLGGDADKPIRLGYVGQQSGNSQKAQQVQQLSQQMPQQQMPYQQQQQQQQQPILLPKPQSQLTPQQVQPLAYPVGRPNKPASTDSMGKPVMLGPAAQLNGLPVFLTGPSALYKRDPYLNAETQEELPSFFGATSE